MNQVRQLSSGAHNNDGDQNHAMMDDASITTTTNNNAAARVCGAKRGAVDDGEQVRS